MFYVDNECVNVFLINFTCLHFFVYVDDEKCKRIFIQFFLNVYSLHDLSTTSALYYLYPCLCLTFLIRVVCFLEFFPCCVSLCCVFYNIFIPVVCLISSIRFIGVPLVLVINIISRKPCTLFIHVVCLISSSTVRYCLFIVLHY